MPDEGPPRSNLVLLVDDDLRTSRRLADMLREDGLAVEVARDGAAAVARFTRAPVPDALVTELTTAHVDAASLSRFARAQRPGMPILIVTGYPNLFQPDTFGGAAPLLFTKPVDYSKLKESLLRALQSASPPSPTSTLPIDLTVTPPKLETAVNSAVLFAAHAVSGAHRAGPVRRF